MVRSIGLAFVFFSRTHVLALLSILVEPWYITVPPIITVVNGQFESLTLINRDDGSLGYYYSILHSSTVVTTLQLLCYVKQQQLMVTHCDYCCLLVL